MLLKANATNEFRMVTPDLPPGEYKYQITVRDSSDSTRRWNYELKGIEAGKIMNLDLRSVS